MSILNDPGLRICITFAHFDQAHDSANAASFEIAMNRIPPHPFGIQSHKMLSHRLSIASAFALE